MANRFETGDIVTITGKANPDYGDYKGQVGIVLKDIEMEDGLNYYVVAYDKEGCWVRACRFHEKDLKSQEHNIFLLLHFFGYWLMDYCVKEMDYSQMKNFLRNLKETRKHYKKRLKRRLHDKN